MVFDGAVMMKVMRIVMCIKFYLFISHHFHHFVTVVRVPATA